MAAAAAAAAAPAPPIIVKLWSSSSMLFHCTIPESGVLGFTSSTIARRSRQSPSSPFSCLSLKTTKQRLLGRASRSEREEDEEENNNKAFTSPEDLSYLWKLGAGSVGGAVVIKYGSVLIPDITRPNILLALFMITAPMVVASLILVQQSCGDEELNKGPS